MVLFICTLSRGFGTVWRTIHLMKELSSIGIYIWVLLSPLSGIHAVYKLFGDYSTPINIQDFHLHFFFPSKVCKSGIHLRGKLWNWCFLIFRPSSPAVLLLSSNFDLRSRWCILNDVFLETKYAGLIAFDTFSRHQQFSLWNSASLDIPHLY